MTVQVGLPLIKMLLAWPSLPSERITSCHNSSQRGQQLLVQTAKSLHPIRYREQPVMIKLDDPNVLNGFLGKRYSYWPMVPKNYRFGGFDGFNWVVIPAQEECIRMKYDYSKGTLRLSAAIKEIRAEEAKTTFLA
jgi:hypothetical protein